MEGSEHEPNHESQYEKDDMQCILPCMILIMKTISDESPSNFCTWQDGTAISKLNGEWPGGGGGGGGHVSLGPVHHPRKSLSEKHPKRA